MTEASASILEALTAPRTLPSCRRVMLPTWPCSRRSRCCLDQLGCGASPRARCGSSWRTRSGAVLAALASARCAAVTEAPLRRDRGHRATADHADARHRAHPERWCSTETVPAAPVPYALATLRLGKPTWRWWAFRWWNLRPAVGLCLPGCCAGAIDPPPPTPSTRLARWRRCRCWKSGTLLRDGDEADPSTWRCSCGCCSKRHWAVTSRIA